MSGKKVFTNGRVFSSYWDNSLASSVEFQECMLVENDIIKYVGKKDAEVVHSAIDHGAETIDLSGRIIVPGFIDGHMHLLLFGLGLRKLDLSQCKSLEAIRTAISQYARNHPDLPRILCRQWFQVATNRQALASMLDDLDPRPIFIEARDCHSTWCNSAALKEIEDRLAAVADKYGSDIHRDSNGNPSGLIEEAAHLNFLWPYLTSTASIEEKMDAIKDAIDVYIESGYTGVIEMAMDEYQWEAVQLLNQRQKIPIHIAAHWAVHYSPNEEQVNKQLDKAIATFQEYHPSKSKDLCIRGIKLFNDGAIGGCTAALSHPYKSTGKVVEPFWPLDALKKVVSRAVENDMQIAIHAIGDVAISQAIEALAAAYKEGGRHRIEHLQMASTEDAKNLAKYGITASIQGVHMDPVVSGAYSRIVQPHIWERAFAFRDFWDQHACVVLGTDAPTARQLPFPNLYNVTTRRSAVQPDLPDIVHQHYALTLSEAMAAQTAKGAFSCGLEHHTGSLVSGNLANFLVLDLEWTPDKLLDAKVLQTWIKGKRSYDSNSGEVEW